MKNYSRVGGEFFLIDMEDEKFNPFFFGQKYFTFDLFLNSIKQILEKTLPIILVIGVLIFLFV